MWSIIYKKIIELLDQADHEGAINILLNMREKENECEIHVLECLDELCEENRKRLVMYLEREGGESCLDVATRIIPIEHVIRKLVWFREKHPDMFKQILREVMEKDQA